MNKLLIFFVINTKTVLFDLLNDTMSILISSTFENFALQVNYFTSFNLFKFNFHSILIKKLVERK